MSRILFVMLHPGFVRYYEGALRGLAAAGHDVHVAFEVSRAKLGEDATAARLATWSRSSAAAGHRAKPSPLSCTASPWYSQTRC